MHVFEIIVWPLILPPTEFFIYVDIISYAEDNKEDVD